MLLRLNLGRPVVALIPGVVWLCVGLLFHAFVGLFWFSPFPLCCLSLLWILSHLELSFGPRPPSVCCCLVGLAFLVVFTVSLGCFLFPVPLPSAPFPAHGVLSCGVRLVCFLGVLSAFTCSIRPSGITLFLLLLSPSIEAPGWLGGTTLFCLWAPLCSLLDGAFVWASPLVT